MTTNIATKRIRTTTEQLNQMVRFMWDNPELAIGKFLKLHGKVEYDRKWRELAKMLNSLAGSEKTVDQWHTVWRDLKSRTNIKIRKRKKQETLMGKKRARFEPITALEKRVLAIIGHDSVDREESAEGNVPMDVTRGISMQTPIVSGLFSTNNEEKLSICCDTSPCDKTIDVNACKPVDKMEMKEQNKQKEIMKTETSFLYNEKDSFEHLGLAWAAKLRKMQPTQSKFAERLISEVLFQGDVGLLTLDTNIQNKRSTPISPDCQSNTYNGLPISRNSLPVIQTERILCPSSHEPITEFIKEEEIL